jgi:cobyric acid synthase CobQ/L-threonine-O-3-phosphate decarboxylase
MTERHGGNIRQIALATGRPAGEILDFSANINPLGPQEEFRPLISRLIGNLVHYPDPDCTDLTAAFCQRYGVPPEETLMGNGSTELLFLLPQVLGKRRALIPVPAYVDYARAVEAAGLVCDLLPLAAERGFLPDLDAIGERLEGDEILVLATPNNPTGRMVSAQAIRELALAHPQTAFVVDEAFTDFTDEPQPLIAAGRPENVAVLKSLTKFYAMPGLRLGAVVASPSLISLLRRRLPPWTVNTLAQAAGAAALGDGAYAEETRRFVRARREELAAAIGTLPGLAVYPSEANFLLVRSDRQDRDAAGIARRLLAEGIAIRDCANFAGLDRRFFRVAVRTADENDRLVDALGRAMEAPRRSRSRRTPAIMFQGTGSNAGKSILCAALCRILLQDGLRVAPFKAQNMSLNSYVTRDGGEMGRAQVVQAQACRLDPDVRMNPVLLKPNSDTGSQVIILGKPVGNMDFWEYTRDRVPPFEAARQAYDSLAAEHDVMVLEGAGSPAEVNLKKRDIVNMNMALYAKAPVLIAGDIDRGGLYASFIGTMECLTEAERAFVAGFVVNRFRGQEAFLAEAHDYVLRRTGRPVLGVVPYLSGLGLPEEDSVSFRDGLIDGAAPACDHVDIAVVDLTRISNFTDIDPFRIEPDVRLRVVRRPEELGEPDAVIIPGSKNVIDDLAFLTASGMAARIEALARGFRSQIVGICGGFQILGQEISDPAGIESAAGRRMAGMALLPVRTELAVEKTLTRAAGRHLGSDLTVYGYEIHHGRTEVGTAAPLIRREDGEIIGVGSRTGLIWGSYLHGIFDADGFRRWFIDGLRMRKGMLPLGRIAAVYDLEPALDRLAEVVRRSLKMDDIYRIMGL